MIPKFSNYPELIKTVDASGTYRDLLQQLNRDLSRTGHNTIAENIIPRNLIVEMQRIIYLALDEDYPAYLQLLYTIDIPEKELCDISAIDIFEYTEKLAFLIIKREWIKILFRNGSID